LRATSLPLPEEPGPPLAAAPAATRTLLLLATAAQIGQVSHAPRGPRRQGQKVSFGVWWGKYTWGGGSGLGGGDGADGVQRGGRSGRHWSVSSRSGAGWGGGGDGDDADARGGG